MGFFIFVIRSILLIGEHTYGLLGGSQLNDIRDEEMTRDESI
jgi:hypothetical protein